MDTNTDHFTMLTLRVRGALSSIHRFCHRDMGYLRKKKGADDINIMFREF